MGRARHGIGGLARCIRPVGGRLAVGNLPDGRGHLVASGDSEREAYARFDEWAKEDRYFPVADELARLAAAGFAPDRIDVRWRSGPIAVVVAVR